MRLFQWFKLTENLGACYNAWCLLFINRTSSNFLFIGYSTMQFPGRSTDQPGTGNAFMVLALDELLPKATFVGVCKTTMKLWV